MPTYSLKKYETYLLSLNTFAKVLNVKIEWKEEPCDGVYIPSRRAIRLDSDMNHTDTLSTFLHELGHLLDFSVLDSKTMNKTNASYGVIYTEHYTEKDVDVVYRAEVRAWNYGRAIGINLGINLGKWYDRLAKVSIQGYKKL